METLLEILNEIDDTVDWESESDFVGNRLLDSFGVISLISELESQFEVDIDASEITPENLSSLESIMEMIQRLQED